MKININNKSLYSVLTIIIVLTIFSTMFIHSTLTYLDTKVKIIDKIKKDSKSTLHTLEKNIVSLIESYALNEYDKLVLNQMLQNKDTLAIVVEDYNMGKILGESSYFSGKIKDANWNITDYDSKDNQQNRKIKNCYYYDTHAITTESGHKLGRISIYTSDRSINQELNKVITTTIINSISISIVLILFILTILHFTILKPLANISKTIKRLDENGLPTELIHKEGFKEIFHLSGTINNMVNSLKISRNELIKQKDILHHQANHDYLTGLPNRILFNDRLEQAIKIANRHNNKFALLFIDLDHFKEINDSLGHVFGDKILKKVTKKLQDHMRQVDMLSRLGGDEFAIIVEDLTKTEDASIYANKIIKELSKSIIIDEHKLYITSSIGISIYPDDSNKAEDLLKFADAAMYKAKDEGRNDFQYYSAEMTQKAHTRVVMETNLRNALKNEEFVVYYQPQMNGKTNTITGMEALVRWIHPTMGIVSPADFIPLAEATGLIVDIDRFVMKSAMTQLVSWYKEGLNPGILAMNLSVKQLQRTDFISMFTNLIKETNCKVKTIQLEVTESHLMLNPKRAITILKQLNKMGIELAIDDFGTGYSSLSYLKNLPISKLKIDKSFVDELPHDEDDIAITRTIIALAKNLNLNIIAEGVETKEQKDFLIENGCENIQGYFYAKPMTAEDMKTFLLNN